MTNAPNSRKTHITRLVGTNKKGEVLQDIWVDVERMDISKNTTQTPEGRWQGLQRKFLWLDDPDGDDYSEDGPQSRRVEIVKVCDVEAEDDPNDPEEWIPIRVIKHLKARGDGQGVGSFQGTVDRLINDELTDARKVVVRRIVHYDTSIDDAAQAAFDADPDRKAYVAPSENYQKDTDTKDEDQYVEHEIVESLKHRTNSFAKRGDVYQGRKTKMLNDYLIDESESATGEIVGANNINPPYRLDPYQNIVNVNFGGLAVEFPDRANIELADGIDDFGEAIIALWFRLPQESIVAANAAIVTENDQLAKVLPLVTIGAPQVETLYSSHLVNVGIPQSAEIPGGALDNYSFFFSDQPANAGLGGSFSSFIGIDCSDVDSPKLVVTLQTKQKPNIQNAALVATSILAWSAFDTNMPPHSGDDGSGWTGFDFLENLTTGLTDTSFAREGRAAAFERLGPPNKKITADHWHLVVLSFKLDTVASHENAYSPTDEGPAHTADNMDEVCKAWINIDDVNYNGFIDLGDPAVDGGGDNDIATPESMSIADRQNSSLIYNLHSDPATYVATGLKIPAGPIGIPASTAFAGKIRKIQLAEFQLWAGQSRPTTTGLLRLFVDADGEPVPVKETEKSLGQPTIRMSRSGNWKKGRNTGTSNPTGEPDFVPTGEIVSWKPDPSLNGPQAPKPKP